MKNAMVSLVEIPYSVRVGKSFFSSYTREEHQEIYNQSSHASEMLSIQILSQIFPRFKISSSEQELEKQIKQLAPMPDYIISSENNQDIAVSVTRAMHPSPHFIGTYNLRNDFTLDEAYRLLYKKIRALLVVFRITDYGCTAVKAWDNSVLHILSESDYITQQLMTVYPEVMIIVKNDFPDICGVDIMITTLPDEMVMEQKRMIFAGI